MNERYQMTTTPEEESCSACKFYLEGECHRNPPSMWLPATNYLDAYADPSTRIMIFWPMVEPGDWCGSFSRAIAPQPQS